MLDFIVKYWVQVLCGVLVAGMGAFCRYFYGLYKKERTRQHDEFQNALREDIKQAIKTEHQILSQTITTEVDRLTKQDTELETKIGKMETNLQNITTGLLSVQGQSFKMQCRALLKPDHVITLSEYENICKDHEAYNSLGGNHEGDNLFGLVQIKYQSTLDNN